MFIYHSALSLGQYCKFLLTAIYRDTGTTDAVAPGAFCLFSFMGALRGSRVHKKVCNEHICTGTEYLC